jgi:hypothetical protein
MSKHMENTTYISKFTVQITPMDTCTRYNIMWQSLSMFKVMLFSSVFYLQWNESLNIEKNMKKWYRFYDVHRLNMVLFWILSLIRHGLHGYWTRAMRMTSLLANTKISKGTELYYLFITLDLRIIFGVYFKRICVLYIYNIT